MATRAKKSKSSKSDIDEKVMNFVRECRDEGYDAKQRRMSLNEDNFNMYHMRHDFEHKEEGQSTEVLSKQPMAVEQISSFFQQALVDMGSWFKVHAVNKQAEQTMLIKPDEIQKVLVRHLEKENYYTHVGHSVKSALLGAVKISKLHGHLVVKPKYISKEKKKGSKRVKQLIKQEDKSFRLKIDLIPQENFYMDPTGNKLYEIEDMWIDLHELKKLSKGDNPLYIASEVNKISKHGKDDLEEDLRRERETNQNNLTTSHRHRVKITEFWGTILDSDGDIMYENIVCTMADDKYLIRKPTENPLWHQCSPYNVAPLIEVPGSVWHKALMDAPTKHNNALNEIYNLMLDGAMKAVNNISQIRTAWLDDPSQVEDGIKPGTTIKVNESAPPGVKIMETLNTGDVPREGMEMMNVAQQEFNSSALTSDLRSGVTPFRQTSATATVEQSNTITSVFQGVAKNYETKAIQKELELAWLTLAQGWQDLDEDELVALFGPTRGAELSKLDPEDIFAQTVQGLHYTVFGVSMTLNKSQDFRKLTTMLQTIGGSEVLVEEFVKKYSFGELMEEILTSLDIDKNKLEIPEMEQQQNAAQQPQQPAQQGGPDLQSQQPQADTGSLQEILGGGVPESQFPGSRATPTGAQDN